MSSHPFTFKESECFSGPWQWGLRRSPILLICGTLQVEILDGGHRSLMPHTLATITERICERQDQAKVRTTPLFCCWWWWSQQLRQVSSLNLWRQGSVMSCASQGWCMKLRPLTRQWVVEEVFMLPRPEIVSINRISKITSYWGLSMA